MTKRMAKRNATLQAVVNKANCIKEREMISVMTSTLLMEANQYKEFQYLYWDRLFIYGPSGDRTRIMFY